MAASVMSRLRWSAGCLALASIVATSSAAIAAQSMACPGDERRPDPSGRWALICREAESPDLPHRILLADLETGRVELLLELERHAEALWAPDGSAVAVTDHAASNESELLVFSPSRPTTPVDACQALVATLGEIPALFENGHRYFTATRWLTPTTLEFEVRAYDAHPGVEYRETFVLDLRTGATRPAGGS